MKLLLPLLDIAVRPISPSIIIQEEVVEKTNYTPAIIICVAVVAIIGLTIFFIKKNKNQNNQDAE